MALMSPEYNAEFYSGWLEGLAQEVDVFNEKSNMTIMLGSEVYIGSFFKEAGYDRIGDLISRRDVSVDTAATDSRMALMELVGVDLASKIGPVFETDENFKRRGRSVGEMATIIGRQAAGDYLKRALDQIVSSLIGTVGVDTVLVDDTDKATATNHKHLTKAMRLFGDKGRNLSAYLMNSEAFYDLVDDKLDNFVIDSVAGVQIVSGVNQGALGKPIIVADIAGLTYDEGAGELRNRVFGLMAGAASALQRGTTEIVVNRITGKENLGYQYQGEYNYLMKVLGYAWNTASGINPTDAAIATPANWSRVFDAKLCGACLVVTDAAN